MQHMRALVKGGYSRKGGPRRAQEEIGYDWGYKLTNVKIRQILRCGDVLDFIRDQQTNWVAHVVRMGNDRLAKQLLFATAKKTRQKSTLDQVIEYFQSLDISRDQFFKAARNRSLHTLLRPGQT